MVRQLPREGRKHILDARLDLLCWRKWFQHGTQQLLEIFETVLANKIGQWHFGKVLAVSNSHAILQVIDGKHDHREPFLSGFKGLLTEITQSQGNFQVVLSTSTGQRFW